MRFFGTRRALLSGSTNPYWLPRVGPFASNAPTDYRSLSDLTISTTYTLTGFNHRGNPAKYNSVNFDGIPAKTLYAQYGAVFIHCNILQKVSGGNAYINVQGESGFGFDEGAAGGAGGASGGGAGAGDLAFGAAGAGGSGTNGENSEVSLGGIGYFSTFNPDSYAYPVGGNGGDGGFGISGSMFGAKGFGAVGGQSGAGGGGGSDSSGLFGAGGAGSPGMIVIVCNEIRNVINFVADGSSGGPGDATTGGGGGSGGGIIQIYSKKYPGTSVASVLGGIGGPGYIAGEDGTAGTAQIYEVARNGTTSLRTFASSWDNL